MRKIFILVLILGCGSPLLHAWFSSGNAGFPGEYLVSFAGGARGLSLGLAQTAIGGQAQSIYANPSGLASLWWKEASFSMTPLFAQGSLATLAYGFPFAETNAVGIGIVRLGSGDAEKTNDLGESIGTFSDQETAILLAFSRKLSARMHAGVNAKIVSQDMDTLSQKGAGMDVGAMYYLSPYDSWGISLENIVPPRLGKDTFPLVVKFGFLRAFARHRLYWCADLSVNDAFGAHPVTKWASGMEYQWPEWFRWRAGVNQKQISAGFGIVARQIDLDYALAYHPLDFIHSLTLTVRYGFTPAEAEQRVRQQWDEFAVEREKFMNEKRQEKEHVDAERLRLQRDIRLSAEYYKASRLYDEKKFDASKHLLQQILAENDQHEGAQRLLEEIRVRETDTAVVNRIQSGESSYRNGDYENALKDISFVLELQPENRRVQILGFLTRAHLLINDRKFAAAKGELIEVMKVDPNNQEAGRLLKRIQTVLDINASEVRQEQP